MMDIIIQIVILFVGLAVIFKASDVVIHSSVRIAKMLHVNEFVIGFVLLSLATSLPELAIAINSIFDSSVGVSIGNLIGASIANITLMIGIVAIFSVIYIRRSDLHDLTTILFITAFFPLILSRAPQISRIIGLALIIVYISYMYSLISKKKTLIPNDHYRVPGLIPGKVEKDHRTIVLFLVGAAALIISAKYILESAIFLASSFGFAQSLMGATIIALGTTLPELTVTLSAAKQKKFSLILGNAIGSTMTNMGLILGIILLTKPFLVDMNVFSDLVLFMVLANIMLWYFISNEKIERWEGIAFIIFYQIFLIVSFIVGFG